jgi:hypothetical protein
LYLRAEKKSSRGVRFSWRAFATFEAVSASRRHRCRQEAAAKPLDRFVWLSWLGTGTHWGRTAPGAVPLRHNSLRVTVSEQLKAEFLRRAAEAAGPAEVSPRTSYARVRPAPPHCTSQLPSPGRPRAKRAEMRARRRVVGRFNGPAPQRAHWCARPRAAQGMRGAAVHSGRAIGNRRLAGPRREAHVRWRAQRTGESGQPLVCGMIAPP